MLHLKINPARSVSVYFTEASRRLKVPISNRMRSLHWQLLLICRHIIFKNKFESRKSRIPATTFNLSTSHQGLATFCMETRNQDSPLLYARDLRLRKNRYP